MTQALHTQRAPCCRPLRANHAAHDGTGADVQSKDQKKKNTPLHVACEKGFVDCIKLLAEAGADLSVRNKAGELFFPGESHAARCGIQQLMKGHALSNAAAPAFPDTRRSARAHMDHQGKQRLRCARTKRRNWLCLEASAS